MPTLAGPLAWGTGVGGLHPYPYQGTDPTRGHPPDLISPGHPHPHPSTGQGFAVCAEG